MDASLIAMLVPVLVALIAASGVYAGVLVTRRQRQAEERKAAEDRTARAEQQKLRAVSYASRLRAHIERGDPPPPEDWPEGIYE